MINTKTVLSINLLLIVISITVITCSTESPSGLTSESTMQNLTPAPAINKGESEPMYESSSSEINDIPESRHGLARVNYRGLITLPGNATDISVPLGQRIIYKTNGGTPDGYGNYPIYYCDISNWGSYSWTQIPGYAVRLAKGPNYLYVVQANGNFHRWNGSSWQWLLSSYTRDVAVAQNGRVWIVHGNADQYGNYPIYYSDNGTSWTSISGMLFRISISSDGLLWGINKQGNVFKWDGSWHMVGGFGGGTVDTDIGVYGYGSSTYVSVVGTYGKVHESFNAGSSWDVGSYCRPMDDPLTTGKNVTACFSSFYAVDNDGVIYTYDFCTDL